MCDHQLIIYIFNGQSVRDLNRRANRNPDVRIRNSPSNPNFCNDLFTNLCCMIIEQPHGTFDIVCAKQCVEPIRIFCQGELVPGRIKFVVFAVGCGPNGLDDCLSLVIKYSCLDHSLQIRDWAPKWTSILAFPVVCPFSGYWPCLRHKLCTLASRMVKKNGEPTSDHGSCFCSSA